MSASDKADSVAAPAGRGRTWPFVHGLEPLLVATPLLALALFESWRTTVSQFQGEDEPALRTVTEKILYQLVHFGHGSIPSILEALYSVDQPPLRYLLALPGTYLFPRDEWGLRLATTLLSLAMVYAIVQLGRDLGGERVGLGAGLLVAASGVFAWTSLSFGWSLIVLALVQAIRLLRRASLDLADPGERRTLNAISAWLAVAFLDNTGCIAFLAGALVVYVAANLRRPLALLRGLAPTAAFYAGYFLWYGPVGRWVLNQYYGGGVGLSGQQTHGHGRVHTALGTGPFTQGLQALDAYLLPFVGIVLPLLALAYLVRRQPRVAILLTPWLIAMLFWLKDSSQYVLLAAIALVPYAVQALVSTAGRRVAATAVIVLGAGFAAWSYEVFFRTYDDRTYPSHVLSVTYAAVERRVNLVEPYPRVAADVERRLRPGDRYVQDVSGSLPMFYLNHAATADFDSRYVYGLDAPPLTFRPGSGCVRPAFDPHATRVRIAITRQTLCASGVSEELTYPGSVIRVYVLR